VLRPPKSPHKLNSPVHLRGRSRGFTSLLSPNLAGQQNSRDPPPAPHEPPPLPNKQATPQTQASRQKSRQRSEKARIRNKISSATGCLTWRSRRGQPRGGRGSRRLGDGRRGEHPVERGFGGRGGAALGWSLV
jgi:hypothetical protein